MNPRLRQNIIFVLFIAALIYGAVNLKGNKGGSNIDSGNPSPKADSTLTMTAEPAIDTAECEAMAWGNDPFYRRGPQTISSIPIAAEPQWRLDGILYDPVAPAAIINKQVVRTGETVDGARITKIDRNKVTIDNKGTTISLNLAKDKI